MGSEDGRPEGGRFGVGSVGQDVELAVRVMDDRDVLTAGWADGPSASEEIDRVVGVEAALSVEGKVKVAE